MVPAARWHALLWPTFTFSPEGWQADRRIDYKDPTSELKPTNFFVIVGSTCRPYEKFGEGAFELTMANGERRYMQAKDKTERDGWIAVLQAVQSAGKKAQSNGDVADRRKSHVLLPPMGEAAPQKDSPFGDKRLTPEDFTFVKVLGKGNYGKVDEQSLSSSHRDLMSLA